MATPEYLKRAIEPGSELHGQLLAKFKKQLEFSEGKMNQFYPRWQMREMQYQAYTPQKDWDDIWKRTVEDKTGANITKQIPTIIVPYSFSTIRTIVTYLSTVFLSRKPIFTVGANKAAFVENARTMEKLLQYNAEHTKLVMHMTQWLYNGEIYGLGIMKSFFKNEVQKMTSFLDNPIDPENPIPVRQDEIVYQGNDVENIDPFLFFPDPRVPMLKVAHEGEFVYWRNFVGKFALARDNNFEHLDKVGTLAKESNGESLRNARANGNALTTGIDNNFQGTKDLGDFVQVDEGTVEIIPEELGIPLDPEIDDDPKIARKYLVTIGNKNQIIRFEPFEADHNMHPIAVNEPYGIGGGFGNLGMADYLAPFQDAISWFLNSHIQNVKGAINNSFIYDPSMINEKDIRSDTPNKAIRVRPKAFGVKMDMYFKQLDVRDVTTNHVNDMQTLQLIGDSISAVSENLRGLQDSGGRKTATEIRATVEAASSRLASHAQYISSTGLHDLKKQWTMNNQQYLTEDFEFQVSGDDGANNSVIITPPSINGDFYFPIHDGNLPVDKVAMFDIWKEILIAVMNNEQLQTQLDLPKIFEFTAKLGGADNIEQFRIEQQSPEAIQQGLASGQLMPMGAIGGGVPSNVNPF